MYITRYWFGKGNKYLDPLGVKARRNLLEITSSIWKLKKKEDQGTVCINIYMYSIQHGLLEDLLFLKGKLMSSIGFYVLIIAAKKNLQLSLTSWVPNILNISDNLLCPNFLNVSDNPRFKTNNL